MRRIAILYLLSGFAATGGYLVVADDCNCLETGCFGWPAGNDIYPGSCCVHLNPTSCLGSNPIHDDVIQEEDLCGHFFVEVDGVCPEPDCFHCCGYHRANDDCDPPRVAYEYRPGIGVLANAQ